MATFIALIDLTPQGVAAFHDTKKRADAFTEAAKKAGATVTAQYWTLGKHDGVMVFDAPDDQTAAALLLELASQGNARTHTLRAFDRSEITPIIKRIS